MHIACFERTMSDDGAMLNLLARRLPMRDLHKVLVENPARLYAGRFDADSGDDARVMAAREPVSRTALQRHVTRLRDRRWVPN
jgi:hypothetical protein